MAQAMDKMTANAPETVQVFYTMVGDTHIFTSPDLPGLHIGHQDLKTAYGLLTTAISGIVEHECGIEADYELDSTFDEFVKEMEHEASTHTLNLLVPPIIAHMGHHADK